MEFDFKNVVYDGRAVSVPISPYPFRACEPLVKELRFVRVLAPVGVDDEETICCEIFHEILDSVEYFAALSYEWGDPSDYGIAIIDGITVPVAVKLLEALRHLRQAKCPVLWIDVLCINQEDVFERNAHLKLMRDIYHEANMVCAYIGPPADGSDEIMSILRAIDRSRKTAAPWTPTPPQLVSREMELRAFFSRSYWHRVWIIQEIALSSRLLVFCGPTSVRWLAFEVLVPLLFRIQQFEKEDHTIEYLHQMRLRQIQRTPTSLLQLLFSSRFAKATDHRDRVYALLGLSFDGTDYVGEPHYDWTESDICLDITKTAIFKHRRLDIILAQDGHMSDSLPSWCPAYFSSPSSKTWEHMAKYIAGLDERFRMGQKSTRWTATNNSIVRRQDLNFPTKEVLIVRGVSLGIIDSTGCTMSDPPTVLPRAMTLPKRPSTIAPPKSEADQDEKLFISVTQILNVYARSASPKTAAHYVTGAEKLYYHLYDFDRFESNWHNQTGFKAELEKIRHWRKRNESFMIRNVKFRTRAHNFCAAKTTGRFQQVLDETAGDIIVVLEAALQGAQKSGFMGSRLVPMNLMDTKEEVPSNLQSGLLGLSDLIDEEYRLMTTTTGHIGWAHPSSRLGDHVYLLEGCSMPVILRTKRFEVGATNAPLCGTGLEKQDPNLTQPFTVIGHGILDEVMDGTLWSTKISSTSIAHVMLV